MPVVASITPVHYQEIERLAHAMVKDEMAPGTIEVTLAAIRAYTNEKRREVDALTVRGVHLEKLEKRLQLAVKAAERRVRQRQQSRSRASTRSELLSTLYQAGLQKKEQYERRLRVLQGRCDELLSASNDIGSLGFPREMLEESADLTTSPSVPPPGQSRKALAAHQANIHLHRQSLLHQLRCQLTQLKDSNDCMEEHLRLLERGGPDADHLARSLLVCEL